MSLARSALFNLFFFAWTAAMFILCLPVLALPRGATLRARDLWIGGIVAALGTIVGIRAEITGRERIPKGPVIIASKHQSAWETLVYNLILDDPAFLLKRELTAIPLFGWYLRKVRMIGIDRKAGAKALRRTLREGRRARDAGRPIVIFPEGTRVAPGAARPYHRGIAALYAALDVPVVPVALNSGLLWARRSFLKRPGIIRVAFLDPIAPGLDRDAFMAELERRIETACARLMTVDKET